MGKGSGILQKDIQIVQEHLQLDSAALGRIVQVDLYLAGGVYLMEETTLLLINDGQELENMGFAGILEDLYSRQLLAPLVCVGIHAGPDRKMEYGTAGIEDYLGRGAKAADYTRFIFDELIPAIRVKCHVAGQAAGRTIVDQVADRAVVDQAVDRVAVDQVAGRAVEFKEKAFAGFSLGALSAMDIVWHRPEEFARVGLFSGSFWWRTKDKTEPGYDEEADRIMQRQVREGGYYPWLKFFFECGTEDEQEDRNHNGIIDSIDDTQDLIRELVGKGYEVEAEGAGVSGGMDASSGVDASRGVGVSGRMDANAGRGDIRYLEIAGGRHEVGTWARAMPEFLLWGWGDKI